MKKHIYWIKFGVGVIVLLSSLNSCSTLDHAAAKSYAPVGSTAKHTRIISKNANLSVDVASVSEAVKVTEGIVAKNKGVIKSLSQQEDDKEYAYLVFYVVEERLDQTLEELDDLGDVTSKHISIVDETKNLIMQDAKLALLKSRQKRLRSLLSQAKTVSDKLAIERELSTIEKELFELNAAKRRLVEKDKMSTITVRYTRKKIRGPLGLLWDVSGFSLSKLFTLRE